MYHPVCVARVYVWLCEQKNCSAINKTKTKKNVRHWNEVKKRKKKKISIHCSSEINTFQDLLQCLSESVRNLHCLLFMLTVWHHDSRSRTLETVSPYQHNTVLKLCHCLVFTEIPGLPLNSKEINWIQFSSPVLHLLSDFFTVWQHINLLNSSRHKCFSTST